MHHLRRTMKVIGVMSGSSLDGIDVACCDFSNADGHWTFNLKGARTVVYDDATREGLMRASTSTALELARLHQHIGVLISEACAILLKDHPAELIASHGHTVFHQPGEGFTTQIGCGATIAARTGLPVVCDFRTKDVALGGQGAPLVPLGERLLYPEHDAFLNLGGISNISLHRNGTTIGYDIGPCNQALDLLANEAGLPYDANGDLARSGTVDPGLLAALNALPFYAQAPPRSIGREWFEEHMRPLLRNPGTPLNDRMRTVVEHIAVQLAAELLRTRPTRCLVTGGGAHNEFLLTRTRTLSGIPLDLPGPELVDFKEAIIFALLGLLRYRGEVNALASVTGASRDNVGGALYLPN